MNYRHSKRDEILDHLEVAVREAIYEGLVGRIEEVDPGETLLKAKTQELLKVRDELDAWDAARDQKTAAMAAWKRLERLVRLKFPIVEVRPKEPRCAGRGAVYGGGCSLTGGWRFTGDVARCKRHAETARGAHVSKLIGEAYAEVSGGPVLNWYSGDRASLAQVQAMAAKLGVDLDQEGVPA